MKRVVLVRPSGPRNVGTIVRVAANFGPCELVLVAPERPSLLVHPEFEQMAHGAAAARERIRVVATLAEALADCTGSYGFTARVHESRRRTDWREARGEAARRAADPGERIAFVFGNEVTGLTGAETAQVAELVHVATSAEHTSLNLAIAVAIVLEGVFVEPGHKKRERGAKPLSGENRAYLKANLLHVLAGRIARTPAARRDVAAMIERVFSRAPLDDRDARAWHLVLRALGSELTPVDVGLPEAPRRARRKGALDRSRRKGEGR